MEYLSGLSSFDYLQSEGNSPNNSRPSSRSETDGDEKSSDQRRRSALLSAATARLRSVTIEKHYQHQADTYYTKHSLTVAIRHWNRWSHYHHINKNNRYNQIPRINAHREISLVKRHFLLWIAYLFNRRSKQAQSHVAASIYRVNILKSALFNWIQAQHQTSAEQFLLKDANKRYLIKLGKYVLSMWKESTLVSIKEKKKYDLASNHSNARTKRISWNYWYKVIELSRLENEKGSSLLVTTSIRLLADSWICWKNELRWRRKASVALSAMSNSLETNVAHQTLERWRSYLAAIHEEEELMQISFSNQSNIKKKGTINHWIQFIYFKRAVQLKHSIGKKRIKFSLSIWRNYCHRQNSTHQAIQFSNIRILKLSLFHWLAATNHFILMREFNSLRVQTQLKMCVRLWQKWSSHQVYLRSLLNIAHSHYTKKLKLSIFFSLQEGYFISHQKLLHSKLIKQYHQHRAVIKLQSNALQQRYEWKCYLKSKRYRYYYLLKLGFNCLKQWQQHVAKEEDRLLRERGHSVLINIEREVWSRWREVFEDVIIEKEREIIAADHSCKQLINSVFSCWQLNHKSLKEERSNMRIAGEYNLMSRQYRVFKQWRKGIRQRKIKKLRTAELVSRTRSHINSIIKLRVLINWHKYYRQNVLFRQANTVAKDLYQEKLLVKVYLAWVEYRDNCRIQRQNNQIAANANIRRLKTVTFSIWKHYKPFHIAEREKSERADFYRSVRLMKYAWKGWSHYQKTKQEIKKRVVEAKQLRLWKLRVEGAKQWLKAGLAIVESEKNIVRRSQVVEERVEWWVEKIGKYWLERTKGRRAADSALNITPLLSYQESEKIKKRINKGLNMEKEEQKYEENASQSKLVFQSFRTSSHNRTQPRSLPTDQYQTAGNNMQDHQPSLSLSLLSSSLYSSALGIDQTENSDKTTFSLSTLHSTRPTARLPIDIVLEQSAIQSSTPDIQSEPNKHFRPPNLAVAKISSLPSISLPISDAVSETVTDGQSLSSSSRIIESMSIPPLLPPPALLSNYQARLVHISRLHQCYTINTKEIKRLKQEMRRFDLAGSNPPFDLTAEYGRVLKECWEYEKHREEYKEEIRGWKDWIDQLKLINY